MGGDRGALRGGGIVTRPTVTLRRACLIEVGRLTRGRPSYAWVQGWTYTTPSGGESMPARLAHARAYARDDYPGARVVLAP